MTVTQADIDRLIRERREAIKERDRLREAAQAVVAAFLTYPASLAMRHVTAINALRAALEPKR